MNSASILLSCDRGYTIVDTQDYERLKRFKWRLRKDKTTCYAITTYKGNTVSLHRLLLNAPKGFEVDHINGDGLDNRRDNLRVVTHQENMQKKSVSKGNKMVNIAFDKGCNLWRVRIQV